MTCIIAYKENGKSYIAGDRMGSNGWTKIRSNTPKIFKKDSFLFGYTSTFRMGQILEHELIIPKRKVDQTLENYVYTDLIYKIRTCFKDNGYGCKPTDAVSEKAGNFIFILEGRIFEVQNDFSVLEHEEFCSIGSGEAHAHAALEVLKSLKRYSPKEKLKKAMSIVAKFVVSVTEECDVLSN